MLSYFLGFILLIWSTNASLNDRLDCYLEIDLPVDQKSCEERGCIWDSEKQSRNVPICYLDPKKIGYKIVNGVKHRGSGLEVGLKLKDTAKTVFKNAHQIEDLKVDITYLTDRILRVKIIDPKSPRYEVPIQKSFPLLQDNSSETDERERLYSVELTNATDEFSLSIVRKSTKTKLFDTSIGGLIYSDQFLQIATNLATNNVYGLGENTHHSLRINSSEYKTYPLFTQDHPTGQEDLNYYGVHPFYTVLEHDGKSHGILLLNSNAMEYTVLPKPGLSFKTLGGVLDLFVFVGDNPGHVIELYTLLIGRPTMPPFWGLGFQLSRCGHANTAELESVINRNMKADIPMDVIYLDFDYMNDSRDFSLNHDRFGKLPQLIRKTKAENHFRWAFIVDPGIEAFNNPKINPPFTDGYEKDVFIKWDKSVPKSQRYNPANEPSDRDVFYGKLWPSAPVVYPDFFKNATHDWWQKWFEYWYNDLDIKFDALWIDMNEPANQNDGKYSCPHNKYDYPGFRLKVNYGNGAKNLSHGTLCMVTVQGEQNQYLHYDVHSLYGFNEMIATQKAVHSVTGKRGFVLSRSTYVSAGRYGAHWLGDNTSQWPHMRYSIIGTLEMNLFGIPFVGPDICGFIDNTTPELCKRWSALGAFYPFSRNHNGASLDQDPGVWAERGHPEVTIAARNSLRIRYQLLPYLYTLFFKAHTRGQTVARPLFHEFPTDNNTFGIDEQFMLGPSLLVSPFLYENQTEVKAYLPNDIWYDFMLKRVPKTGFVSLPDNDLSVPPLHFRGGSIIPISIKYKSVTNLNSESVRKEAIELAVFPGIDKTASGDLFWDDGESIDTIQKNEYNFYTFNLNKNCSLEIKVDKSGYNFDQTLEWIEIYSKNTDQLVATLDGKPVESYNNKDTPQDRFGFVVKINLNSKKAGEKWILNWKSAKTNSCNML